MQSLVSFARTEVGVVLVALALVVGYQLLTGKINMNGLLLEKTGTGVGGYSPARLQLMLITLVAAFYFISEVANSIHNGTPQFPDVSQKWLLMLGGSHSIYLGGKVNSLFGFFGGSETSKTPKGDS
jgi:hypothetical protein